MPDKKTTQDSLNRRKRFIEEFHKDDIPSDEALYEFHQETQKAIKRNKKKFEQKDKIKKDIEKRFMSRVMEPDKYKRGGRIMGEDCFKNQHD
jgi:hypothetical protein